MSDALRHHESYASSGSVVSIDDNTAVEVKPEGASSWVWPWNRDTGMTALTHATAALRQDVKKLRLLIAPAIVQLHAAVRKMEGRVIEGLTCAHDTQLHLLSEETLCRIDYLLLGSDIQALLDELKKLQLELLAPTNQYISGWHEERTVLAALYEHLVARQAAAGMSPDVMHACAIIRASCDAIDVPMSRTKAELLECIREELASTDAITRIRYDAALVVAQMYFNMFL